MSQYPDKNPFPYQGTMTVEASSDPESDDSYQIPRTLPLESVRQTLKLVSDYLERFAGGKEKRGQFAVIRGDHGSGKTHAIKYVLDRIVQDAPIHSRADRPLQLYGQGKFPEFMPIYRQLVSQISLEDLQDANLRFLGVVASEQLARVEAATAVTTENVAAIKVDQIAGEDIATKLRDTPEKVFELFNNYLVEKGAVEEKQKSEVKKLSPGKGDDFRRAFSYILSPELARPAYNWLIGTEITEEEKRRLGVSGPLVAPDSAAISLQLLAALFNRVGRPLIIFIDQYEKLILAKDKTLAAGNAGLIHSLVEIIPRENGMFVLSGNEEAWDALPRDLVSRFAGNIVDFPVLRPDEASEMIRLYLTPTADDFHVRFETSVSENANDFYPFEGQAIRTIVRYSAGNIRNLLQICSTVFDAAAPNQRLITTRLVDSVLKEGKLDYSSLENVGGEIERVLRERSLQFSRDFRIGETKVDFAVVDEAGDPQLFIEVNEAAFHEQEAQRALEALAIVQSIRQHGIQAPIIFVALGYVSDEVTKAVREFTQEFIIYKPKIFRKRLGKALTKIRVRSRQSARSQEYIRDLESRLHDLSTKLENVLVERKEEADVVEKRLAQLFERQATERLEERRQAARPAWAEERRRVEKEIQDVRRKRKQEELQEMERLRERAQLEQQRRAWLQGLVFLIPALIWVGYKAYLLNEFRESLTRRVYPFDPSEDSAMWSAAVWSATISSAVVLLAAVLLVTFMVLRSRNVFAPSLYRELSGPVGSLEDLDRLAHQYLARIKNRPFISRFFWRFLTDIPARGRRLLRHSNPHYRYAGVFAVERTAAAYYLMDFLKAERSSIVRRVAAQQLGTYVEYKDVREYLPRGLTSAVAYIIDGGMRVTSSEVLKLSPPLQTLAAIHGAFYSGDVPGWASPALALAASEATGPDSFGLFEAFRNGLDRVSEHMMPLSEASVREASGELSPFDEGGLGTLDELRVINKVDQYYLFFRQMLFLMERDLLYVRSEALR